MSDLTPERLDALTKQLRGWDHCWPAPWLETATIEAADAIAELRAEVERLTRERDEAEVRAGEMRMCVNCGKVRHAGEPKDDLPECTDPATGFAACTWDATPQEAWRYWRDEAHRKHERATAAEADAAAAREQVRKLRERIDHTFEDALAMWHNPEGTLWNHGTTPTARDRAEWAAIRDTVQTLLGVLDPDRARAALQGEGER